MTWVDYPSYFGPDRRRRATSFRLLDRRRANFLGGPPTMAAGLRRLKMRMIDAVGPQGLAAFARDVDVIAQLARLRDRPDIAALLQELHLTISDDEAHGIDHRLTINFALAACDDLLVQRGPRTARGGFITP